MTKDKGHDEKRCSLCGAVLKPDGKCTACGSDQGRGIEIAFKKFKISELLDIKVQPRTTGLKETGKREGGKK